MTVEPFDQLLVGDRLRQSIYVALGAVVLVLLIACANITNLLLAQGAARRQEMAVRAALGAGRGRIAAQLLVETLVLGLLGGVAGVGLAALLVRVAVPLLPPMPVHRRGRRSTCGCWPLPRSPRWPSRCWSACCRRCACTAGSAAAALNTAARGSSGGHDRTRRTIVAAEVAVSVVLICGAFLLFKSLLRLQQVDVGARLDHVITMSLDLPRDRYPTAPHSPRSIRRLVERVRAIPGVVSASMSGDVPLEGTGGENLRMPGREERLLVRFKRADADYFATLGIPVIAGPRVHTRRPGRRAVRRGGQRGAGPPARRPLRPGRSRSARPSICRRSASAAIAARR